MSAKHQAASRAHSGHDLVEHLKTLVTRGDLGALALLRRGLGRQPGAVPEIYAHVVPYLSASGGSQQHWGARGDVEDAGLLVAALFALWHQGKPAPRSEKGTSLGKAYRQVQEATNSGSIEGRFVALLKASRATLPKHLRQAVSLLRAKEIPLDWEKLFEDLCRWDETDQRARHVVRGAWARDFWGGASAGANGAPAAGAPAAEGGDEEGEEGDE